MAMTSDRERRAAVHAALGDPHRLAIVDDLIVSDRSPRELSERLDLASNLLAHHLDVLHRAGIVTRTVSAGDRRRRYVQLDRTAPVINTLVAEVPSRPVMFLCTHNSARSQLAAALWRARTGLPATSAGTDPAPRVHRRAVGAATRIGIDLSTAEPRPIDRIPDDAHVITVCDNVHEELTPTPEWWHWSIADPVPSDDDAAFEAVIVDITSRINRLTITGESQ